MKTARIDTATRIIRATAQKLYTAHLDQKALAEWLPPKGMRASITRFEPRAGGCYEMTLTYLDPDATDGKTSSNADTVRGQYVELAPLERIVQTAEFESDDSAFAGTMRMTWTFEPVAEGTRVTIRCEDVPPGIRKEDHLEGLSSSLENLAAFVESRPAHR